MRSAASARRLPCGSRTRRRREFLVGGILAAAIFYALRLSGTPAGLGVDVLVNAYFGFFWIFLLVGFARAHIKSGGPGLAYANEAVYPFYILHQTIRVVFGYWRQLGRL